MELFLFLIRQGKDTQPLVQRFPWSFRSGLLLTITPSRVTRERLAMEISCPGCGRTIILKQPYQYHAGFSDRGFLYCDSCSGLVTFSTYNPFYVRLVGEKHPWSLNQDEKQKVEDHLQPCCGGAGHYRFDAPPRCPYCNCSLSELLIDKMHYIEIGDVVDADKQDIWLRDHPSGP